MQNLELILLIASGIYIFFGRNINKKNKPSYLAGVLVAIIVSHLLIEGIRWQMTPTYLFWLIALVTSLKSSQKKSPLIFRVIKNVGLLFLLGLSIALPSILPVFNLPKATGAYSVGTTDIYLELNRPEVITSDTTDTRNFMIKTWYPSHENHGEMDAYVDPAGRNGFAAKYGLSYSMLDYLDKVKTNVYRNIPIADEKFPVLVFSHGYHSKANSYYALLTELASQGYVIFANNHTYESTGSTFPNGDLKYFDNEYAQKIQEGTWESMKPLIEAFKNGLSFEERHTIVQERLRNYFVKDMVERWSEDIKDVVTELDEWNSRGFFKGKLDLNNIGVVGHSRGGGAAGDALLKDNRIRAGVNIDGVQWGQIVDTVFQQPFLFLSADWPEDHEDLNQHAYINKSNSVFYEGTVLQSGHSNFMDIPFMIPLRNLSQAGAIDPYLAIEITSKTVTSFFDKHLKEKDVDFKALDAEYEMLNLSIYKGKNN